MAERSARRKRAKLERSIALRLYRYDHVVAVCQLATELASRSTSEAEARAVIARMVQSGSLAVQGRDVLPTAQLGRLALKDGAPAPRSGSPEPKLYKVAACKALSEQAPALLRSLREGIRIPRVRVGSIDEGAGA